VFLRGFFGKFRQIFFLINRGRADRHSRQVKPCGKSVPHFLSALRPGQMLEVLFDAVPDAHFFVKDPQSRFLAASRSFLRLVGVSDIEELIGRTDHDFSADFLADAFLADDRRVMESGCPIINQVELVPTGDSLDWLTTTKVPLYDAGGKIAGLAGITRLTRDSDVIYRDHPELRRIVDYIRKNFRRRIPAADLAKAAGISVSSVERLFRKAFGMTPRRYRKWTMLNAACQALRDTDHPLGRVARECGFGDQASMTRDFRGELNLTPRKCRIRFRNGGPKPYRADRKIL